MAIVPAQVYRKIEWYLHNREQVKKEIDEFRRGVVESGPTIDRYAAKGAGSHGDSTALRALRLLEPPPHIAADEAWLWVIDKTYEAFRGTRRGELMDCYYGHNITCEQAMERLCLNRRQSFFEMKADIVSTAAMAALQRGLITVFE